MAAQKRLGDGATNGHRAAFRREIARLQQLLANVVRRELAEGLP